LQYCASFSGKQAKNRTGDGFFDTGKTAPEGSFQDGGAWPAELIINPICVLSTETLY
jgi:hypothetical protein